MNRAISPALPLKREWKETAEVACSDTRPVQGAPFLQEQHSNTENQQLSTEARNEITGLFVQGQLRGKTHRV